jgi:hypothetical protein
VLQVFFERLQLRIDRYSLGRLPEESKDMLAVFLALAEALQNLLVRGRGLILDERFRGQPGIPHGLSKNTMDLLLHLSPTILIGELAGARLEQKLRRHCILVSLVPILDQPLVSACGSLANPLELSRLDMRRQRPPAVAFPEQHNEVGLDPGLLAAFNLAQADFHGLLVESRLVAHAPAQVDGLEARVVLLAELAQPENLFKNYA